MCLGELGGAHLFHHDLLHVGYAATAFELATERFIQILRRLEFGAAGLHKLTFFQAIAITDNHGTCFRS